MLPEQFKARMRLILGNEYDAFITALESERTSALRLNPLKASEDILSTLTPFTLQKIPHIDYGFRYTGAGIGNTPAHHAGAIYVQDAGAMCAVEALSLFPGARVLDVCASPGGKSTQAAAKIGKDGFLVANEYVASRAKILVENFERLGLPSAMVLNLDTKELGAMFDGYFDAVICDAPCSGEGMFRKTDEAAAHWSEENIRMCAERQLEILLNIKNTVRAGGELLYSTCTYAPEENEEVVRAFLRACPDFTLSRVPQRIEEQTAPALPTEGVENITYARRFYPHRSEGEGQFIALFKRENVDVLQTVLYKDASKPLSREQERIINDFLKDVLSHPEIVRPRELSGRLVHISGDMPIPQKKVFMGGVLLGEIRGKNFFPSHQFFSAFGKDFKRQVRLHEGDADVGAYLHGEEISADVENGWCAVLYEGVVLGGGKASAGRVKNHYPKGLRK
ncbi:MAG: SAM-dependent methyltransferase [Clostridia bacterium]|nr:SAM-dependent methyltransferase [Clostridia bacterium]